MLDQSIPDWHRDALCSEPHYAADAHRWFSNRTVDIDAAKDVCIRCSVWPQCLAGALDDGLPGVWGGTDEKQRKQILREGIVTADLLRRHGTHALHGRELE